MHMHSASPWHRKPTRRPGVPKPQPARARHPGDNQGEVEGARRLRAAAGGESVGRWAFRPPTLRWMGPPGGWDNGGAGASAATGIGGMFTTGTRNG